MARQYTMHNKWLSMIEPREMSKLCHLGWVFVSSVIFFTAAATGQTGTKTATGNVSGFVVDAEGKPVAQATVFTAGAYHPQTTATNADGSFELPDLPPGQVYLVAYKEADGYPNNADNFFNMPGEIFPVVDVTPNKTTEGVIIRLGAKAAYLDFDISGDAGGTNEADVYFWRPDHDEGPHDWAYTATISAHQRHFLVPPVPFGLKVTAKGFESWSPPGTDSQTGRGLIKLKSGETLTLSIHLKRDTKSPRGAKN